jgi:L-arabinose transport system substrate-binding protein
MKKRSAVALLLVLAMLLGLALVGCSSSGSGAASASPAASPSTPAATSAAPSDAGQASASPAATSAAPGKPLNVVYLSYAMGINWCVQFADAMKDLGAKNNINVEVADGNFKPETQMSQLDQYLSKGVDAVVCMLVDEGAAQAMADRCKEANVLLLGEATPFYDANNKLVCPCSWVNGIDDGTQASQWVVDNYKRLGFDYTDLSTVGYIYFTDTTFAEMQPRVDGANGVWLKAFPDFPKENMFLADRSADKGSNMEAGYNQTAAILTAHPEMKQWVIISMQEDYASGACRAVEDKNLVDKTILVSLGGENVIPEWDNGMTKPWYASCYFTGYDEAINIMNAIDKILRQGVAPEDVYPNKDDGQTYGYMPFSGRMIAFDNYKTLIQK